MASQNYYQFFGISKDAKPEEIKRAYRILAHKYHPDKNKGEESAEQKMKEINFIYSILSNTYKRKSYDETLGAKEYFDNFNWNYEVKKSWVNIYCDELETIDSTGKKTKIKVGQRIFYPVEIDKSIITWKYKRKEYFDVYIKKIFDTSKKDSFDKVLNYDLKKEPLCLVNFGKQDLIIYYEDFRSYWLAEKSYKKIDVKKGLITAGIVALALIVGIYYLFLTHPITQEQRNEIRNGLEYNNENSWYRDFLKDEYKATDGEINYIESGRYKTCSYEKVKITDNLQVKNAPDFYAIATGELPKDTEVIILLYYADGNSYKIISNKIIGWVPANFLDRPICDTDQE
jgi:curved DNA-binding protein CbpA